MHCAVFVITPGRPTEQVLAVALAEPVKQHQIDWYGLGGRYGGRLQVKDLTRSVSGGFDEPGIEEMMRELLPGPAGPPQIGAGCDAAPIENIIEIGVRCTVFLCDGLWTESESIQCLTNMHLLTNRPGMGDRIMAPADQIRRETAALQAWDDFVSALIEIVPTDHWLSVVDCHR